MSSILDDIFGLSLQNLTVALIMFLGLRLQKLTTTLTMFLGLKDTLAPSTSLLFWPFRCSNTSHISENTSRPGYGGSVVSGHKKDKASHRMAALWFPFPEMTNFSIPWLLGGFRSRKMTSLLTHVSFCGLLGLRIYFRSFQMHTP